MTQQKQSLDKLRCSECGQAFESEASLREHERECRVQADRASATPK
jgi:hypothetical protein